MNEARVRPIDANKLMRLKRWATEYDEAGFSAEIRAVPADDIDLQPTLDYAPVVHAKWEKEGDSRGWRTIKFYHCSKCGRVVSATQGIDLLEAFPYCHCGAKMGGDGE